MSGLVITRREGEVLWIGDAKVTVERTRNGAVALRVEAPSSVRLMRGELLPDREDS